MSTDARSNAPRIPRSTWEKHRCRIKALFVDQKKTLSKTIEIMKQHGLHASESQYERQLKIWGIRKNRTREEWCLIKRVVEERRLQGRDSTVLIEGIVQPNERLERELTRSDYRLEQDLPEHIQVISPPPTAPSPENALGYSDSEDIVLCPTQANSFLSKPTVKSMGGARTRAILGLFFQGSNMLEKARKFMSAIVRKFGPQKTFASALRNWLSPLGIPDLIDWDEPYLEDLNVLMSDYEPGGGNSPVVTPPSPSGSWSLPSLESVGITSEEWVTRGWNVFFGAWG